MKGITKIIAELILAVIVIVILGTASVAALPYIQNLLAQYFGLTTDTAITEAVECSYIRCDVGCSDAKVQSNVWRNLPGNICPCSKDFQDKNGKICGENSLQYPVEIPTSISYQSPVLTKMSFSAGINCIYSNTKIPTDFPWISAQAKYNFLILSSDILKLNPGQQDKCEGPVPGITNFVVSSNTAEKGRIYVSTASPQLVGFSISPSGILQNIVWTQAWGRPVYTILDSSNNYKATLSLKPGPNSQVGQKYQVSAAGNRFVVGVNQLGGDCYSFGIKKTNANDVKTITFSATSVCSSGVQSNKPTYVDVGGAIFKLTYLGLTYSDGNQLAKFDLQYLTTTVSADMSSYGATDPIQLRVSTQIPSDLVKLSGICPKKSDGSCDVNNVYDVSQTIQCGASSTAPCANPDRCTFDSINRQCIPGCTTNTNGECTITIPAGTLSTGKYILSIIDSQVIKGETTVEVRS
ncbi:hypothetical protein EPN87_02640 [archaeon]|nr:MAG: hypothetical protein EPN87_02640 [archaeon]